MHRYSQQKVGSCIGTKLSAAAWPSVELQNSLFAFHRFMYRPSTVSMDMVILTLLFCAQTHGLLYGAGKLNAQFFIAAACISSHFWCHWASVPWAPAPRKQPDPTWRPNYFLCFWLARHAAGCCALSASCRCGYDDQFLCSGRNLW